MVIVFLPYYIYSEIMNLHAAIFNFKTFRLEIIACAILVNRYAGLMYLQSVK